MYCKVCGKKIEDNSKFCQFCGAEMSNTSKDEKIFEKGGIGKLTTPDGKSYVVTGSEIYE